jgi:hypothetical protein
VGGSDASRGGFLEKSPPGRRRQSAFQSLLKDYLETKVPGLNYELVERLYPGTGHYFYWFPLIGTLFIIYPVFLRG